MNADDFYLEDTLARVAKIVEREPSVDLIVGDTVWVDEEARVQRLLPGHPNTTSVTLHYGMTAAPSSFFVRSSTIRSIGFREDTKFIMDKWLFAELAIRRAACRYVNTPLGAMRRHDQQVSANARDASGDDERQAFRTAFGLPELGVGLRASRLYGRCLHVALKARTAGYARELRWRSKQGQVHRRASPSGECPTVRNAPGGAAPEDAGHPRIAWQCRSPLPLMYL